MLLLILSLLSFALCQNDTLIGYISIDNKLLSNLTEGEVNTTVKAGEQFNIHLATVTPYRWMLYTPNMYPYIRCKQKIIDKEISSSNEAEEVLQTFQCKGMYQGFSYIKLSLKSMDLRLNVSNELEAKVWINIGTTNISNTLNQTLPDTIPTHPPVSEVPKEVIAVNSYNRWTNKKKGKEEPMQHSHRNNDYIYDDYYDRYGYNENFYTYFDDDEFFIEDYDFDYDYEFDYEDLYGGYYDYGYYYF